MRSPCLHYNGPGKPCIYLHIEKNNETCRACKRRLEYVDYIESDRILGRVIKTKGVKPMEETPKLSDKKPIEKITRQKCAGEFCPLSGISQSMRNFDVSATSKIPFKYCKTCKAAEAICKIHEVELADIRGGKAFKVPAKTAAIQEIIETLHAKPLDVSVRPIAKLLGISKSAVYSRLEKNKASKPKDKPEEKPEDPQDKIKVAMASFAHKEIIGHISDPDDQADLPPGTISVEEFKKRFAAPDGENKYKIEIDFSKHREVFDELIDLADERLRDPDKMIIFILFKIFQEGVKINETISTD